MNRYLILCIGVVGLTGLVGTGGCAAGDQQKDDFFTSGNREADQRAEQRMAKAQQLSGEGQNDERGQKKKSLYDRLGAEKGLGLIVDDFVGRALADPRVNWERKGMKAGGFLGMRKRSVEWNAGAEQVAQLKKHLVQFLSVATGGPAHYDGREMKDAHTGLKITNAEFDASVGDLKATLDKLGVGNDEQKELLAIIESTRTQVVEQR